MALKYKLDAEAFGAMEEGQQALYKKNGNVYLLEVEGIESDGGDTAALKAKVEQLLTEKKEGERKAKEEQERVRLEAEEKLKTNGDFKQLYESQKTAAEKYKTDLDTLNATVKRQTVTGEAARIAAGMTKDTARASLLAEKIASRLQHTDDGLKVLDESGQLTVSTIEDLTSQIKKTFPFLVDGSQASGGAAPGSKGGAGESKQMARSDWNKLDHPQRMEFNKSGGVIVDD